MEAAIKNADPDRWARYLLRRGQEEMDEEEDGTRHQPEAAVPPAPGDGESTPRGNDDDDDGWEGLFDGLDGEGDDSGQSGSAGTAAGPDDLVAAVESTLTGQQE